MDSADGRKLLCGETGQRQLNSTEFVWETGGRSTFSVDWNLQCGREYLFLLSGSLGYVGNLIGSTFGNLYDVIGRKRGALIGCGILFLSNLAMIGSPNIEVFLLIRVLWGIGLMGAMDGIFVIMMEYTPARHKPMVNSGFQFFWAVGYILTSVISYYITSWKWLIVANIALYISPTIAVSLLPESPGFFLINKNDESSAKKSLTWLKESNHHGDLDLEKVTLVVNEEGEDSEEKTFMETLKDFIQYRELTIQVLLQIFLWFTVGLLYYGFTFTWAKFGKSLYLSYLYPALAEAVAYVAMTIPLKLLGRKASNLMFFSVACFSFLAALIPGKLKISTLSMTVEQISCLIGVTFISAAFGGVYIFSAELAPTSHRGKIMGYTHWGSQIGAIIGPQITLLQSWNWQATYCLLALTAGLSALMCLRLPETKGIASPNTAEEVQARRQRAKKRRKPTVFRNSTVAMPTTTV